jgi:RNA-directed DNA polymerase
MLEKANAQGNAWDKSLNVALIERWQTSSRSLANIQPKGTQSIVKDRVHLDIGARRAMTLWAAINWQLVKKRIKNLRGRIYRATQNGQWNRVRSLMKLMLRSYSNILWSVRRVTQENQGKRTAGIDGQTALSSLEREQLIEQMQTHQFWQVHPTKRVYIPKAGGKLRSLGVPTIANRIAQTIVKNALEPSWEARFDAHSYGFRPGRGCHDAIEQCFLRLKAGGDTWILDGDLKGAFDHLSHNFILNALSGAEKS